MTNKIERRFIPATETELRASPDGKKIVGHAAVFNTLSENLGGFREKITPGAFKDALKTSDIRALFNHDPNYVLGRVKAGTLTVGEDERGLAFDVTPPDAQWARDLMVSIGRGDISGTSFGFRVAKGGDTWEEQSDGTVLRTINKFEELRDVSPVTYPAYPDASVALRSLEEWKAEKEKEQQPTGTPTDTRRKRLALEESL